MVKLSMIVFLFKVPFIKDPRWQWSKWKVHSPPHRAKLESQLNYIIINLNNQQKTS